MFIFDAPRFALILWRLLISLGETQRAKRSAPLGERKSTSSPTRSLALPSAIGQLGQAAVCPRGEDVHLLAVFQRTNRSLGEHHLAVSTSL